MISIENVLLRCPKCHSSFRVLEDEQFDHDCPHCGPLNLQAQPEHWGSDYFSDEILEGDDIVMDGEEVILQSNLEEYLTEKYGFTFKTAH